MLPGGLGLCTVVPPHLKPSWSDPCHAQQFVRSRFQCFYLSDPIEQCLCPKWQFIFQYEIAISETMYDGSFLPYHPTTSNPIQNNNIVILFFIAVMFGSHVVIWMGWVWGGHRHKNFILRAFHILATSGKTDGVFHLLWCCELISSNWLFVIFLLCFRWLCWFRLLPIVSKNKLRFWKYRVENFEVK